MTLHELLDTVIQHGDLTPARIPPMRTAVKQYAAMLGMDAAHCPPKLYHRAPAQLASLIDTKAPSTLGTHTIRNLKNNLRFLLRKGIDLGFIAPLTDPLQGWRGTHRIDNRWNARRRAEYPLTPRTPYTLHPLPAHLATEVQAFDTWSTATYLSDRPRQIKKRASTMTAYLETIEGIAGFAHHVQGIPAEALTLQALTEPELVKSFLAWWIARQGKVTRTAYLKLGHLKILTKYWLKDDLRTLTLTDIQHHLPPPEQVHNKDQRWLSLAQLEAVGLSQYPLNSRRVQESPHNRQLAKEMAQTGTVQPSRRTPHRRTAVYVAYSLMLRLLVRIPLRQRNIREMQLERNLRRLPNGTWQLVFRGEELKIAWRNRRRHEVTYAFPEDLQGLLEEWLTTWRPLLLTDTHSPYVFLLKNGEPFKGFSLRSAIERMTWKYAGVTVNPHMIRDIWATEYIKSTRDIAGAAYMLGNTVQIILRHYAHLLDAEVEQRATTWLHTQLN
jgi:hypothetical protein